MPAYSFEALDPAGTKQSGVLEGDSARQVRELLRERGWLPTAVEVAAGAESGDDTQPWYLRRTKKRIGSFDLALIMRQLAVLIASGSPLEETLAAVARQSEKRSVKTLLLSVRSKVLEGFSLARALDTSGNFPALVIATIRAGEQSGHLDAVLNQLADYTESRYRIQKQIRGALIYPVFMMIFSLGIVMALMSFVVPKIVSMFDRLDAALPLVTQIVMSLSNFLVNYGWLLLIGVVVAVVLLRRAVVTEAGRATKDRWLLKTPIFGKLTRGLDSARMASTLAILVGAGVPLVEALRIAAQVASNVHISQAIRQAGIKVTEGAALSPQLERAGYFSPMMVQMIRSGENSGELEAMLTRAADMQHTEANDQINALLALLGPLLMIVLGFVVAIIVFAVMLPIVSLNNLAG